MYTTVLYKILVNLQLWCCSKDRALKPRVYSYIREEEHCQEDEELDEKEEEKEEKKSFKEKLQAIQGGTNLVAL